MSKFSVKKPLTVFVAVIAVIVLGVVAYLNMTPDLLPNMDFPYVVLVTTYPGASPEKVEAEVTKPLEQSMSTLEHIKEVSSTSAENYSMVMLEFEEGVNLDAINVDIQQSIVSLSGSWDEMVSTPYVLKINPSMLPVMVAAVSMEGMDTVELTQYLDEGLMNKLEGVPGVARISTSGTVVQQLHVVLDQAMIDSVNKAMAQAINDQMDEALEELEKAEKELETAQAQLDSGKAQMDEGKAALAGQVAAGEAELSYQQLQLIQTKGQLQTQLAQLQSAKQQLESTLGILKAVESGLTVLTQEAEGLAAEVEALLGLQALADQLEQLRTSFEEQLQTIREDVSLTQEQRDEAIVQLQQSQAYQNLQAQAAQLEAALKANGTDLAQLQALIQQKQTAYEALKARISNLKDVLTQQKISPDALSGSIAEMEKNLSDIDAGMAAIQDGLSQIDAGMLEMKDAQVLLSRQKTEGLLQLAQAQTELTLGQAGLQEARTQLEEGRKTLEQTREKTLEQADLSGILTMDMITGILTAQNFAMPAGTVEQEGVSYMVSVGEELTQVQQLEELLLFDMGMEGVEPVYLKDVAMVMLTDNRDETYARLNGQDSVVLSFEKQSTYATAEATDNILDRFAALEQEHDGLSFVSLMNQGDYIYLIVETIISSLLLGAVFSVLVLFLFLKDLRPTVITLCSIPISVIFAIVLMYFSGVTINMISLSGLAVSVGMLVDNSVVVIENIYRLRAKGANVVQAAVSGAKQVAGAVTASTLTTVCVFLPIVFVEGITRQLFTDLALTMTYSLMASLIVALTLVPAMASGMLRKEKQQKQTFMDRFLNIYEKAAAWSLDHKAIVLIGATVLLAGSGVWAMVRGFIFMPTMDMPSVTVSITMPEEASSVKAAELADEVLRRIETIEGVETVGAMQSGTMDLMGAGQGGFNVTVYVTLADETASGAAVGKQIDALCEDMECTVSSSSAMLDMSMLSGSGVSLRLYGEDMEQLQQAAVTVADALSQTEGFVEVDNGLGEQTPALHIDVDRNKAMAKGITVAQIYMELAAALQNSATVTTLDLEGTATELIVEKPADGVLTAEQLADYPFSVTTQTGQTNAFTLSEVASVEQTTSLASIARLNQRRYVTVSAGIAEGENVTLMTAEAQRILRGLDLGSGVSYVFAGENETITESMEQLGLMLVMGVLLVYLVMVAQFQSLKSPFIVMFTIPLAFTGGFAALLICGMEVSVISMIGFIMLTGIIVNNGIVLVDYINQLRAEGLDRRQAILEAGKTRMRPILMTTITTILGLLDMAVRKNVGTSLMQPVAVVCIGGLTYATMMTLFIVPIIYDMMNKKALRTVNEQDLELLDF